MSIIEKLRHLKKSLSSHEPLIKIFIYKDHLLHNLHEYQQRYPALQFAPVLKANAYGHGLEQVLMILRDQTLPFVVVDSHFELRIAQKFAPNLQVLVVGFSRLESILKSKPRQASFAIVSFEQLEEISKKLKSPKRFHLKLDTGMHRQGVLSDAFAASVNLIKNNPNIILDGLCSHLADPDNEAQTFKQIENWNSAVKFFKKEFPKIKYTHLSATGGVKYSQKIDANLVRLGIGFYGIDDYHQAQLNLKPAFEMRSLITGIKIIDAGEKIGYGFTYTASQKMKIATVPVGYYEGVDLRLSNKGYFKVGQNFCPILGRVSMNISTIDVTDVPAVAFSDEVIIISNQSSGINTIQNIALACNTIPYEILVHISSLLSRKVI